MRIIIVGCGKVGSALAEQLSAEGHELTLIDLSERRLEKLTNRLDLTAVAGSGTSYQVLLEAGVQDTDLVIAVTTHDEINLLSCLIARKASDCHAIARVRDPQYVADLGFIRDELGISMAINPELSAARVVSRLIRFPSATRPHRAARRPHSGGVTSGGHGGMRGQSPSAHQCTAVHGPPRRHDLYPQGRLHSARGRRHHGHYPPEGAEILLRPDRRPQHAHQERHAGRRRQNRLFPRENPA